MIIYYYSAINNSYTWYGTEYLVPFPFSCLFSNSGSSYHYKFLVMCWDEVCFPVALFIDHIWVFGSYSLKQQTCIPWVRSAGSLPCSFKCSLVVPWVNCWWTCGNWVERIITSVFCAFLVWLLLTPCKARQVQCSGNVGQAQKSCFQFSLRVQYLFRRQYNIANSLSCLFSASAIKIFCICAVVLLDSQRQDLLYI